MPSFVHSFILVTSTHECKGKNRGSHSGEEVVVVAVDVVVVVVEVVVVVGMVNILSSIEGREGRAGRGRIDVALAKR